MRLLVRMALAVVANAVALLLAAVLLDGFTIDKTSFVVAVIVFSIASLILRPLVAWVLLKGLRPLIGVVALVTTFVLLLVTDLLSDGIDIEGLGTWLAAVVIVWLATMVYDFLALRLQRRLLLGLGRG